MKTKQVSTHGRVRQQRIKALVAALRSGKYKQTTTGLRKISGGHCCLGVACELYRKAVGGRWSRMKNHLYADFYAFSTVLGDEQEQSMLPDKVAQWYGWDTLNPVVAVPDETDTSDLAGLNDAGSTFEEIATLIEVTYVTATPKKRKSCTQPR